MKRMSGKKGAAKAKPGAKEPKRETIPYSARIKVVGVGGGGGNAVSRMRDRFTIRGVDFIAINTDAQDLDYCNARHRIYIGRNLTKGLGTGMNPELGRQAAEENRSEIAEALRDADLVFLTAGLGGGTGTGAIPVVAEAAKEAGALTVAVVTKPFGFEGAQRARIAQEGLVKLKDKVDTLIVVPNDRIFTIIKKDTLILKAFEAIDDVLQGAVQGIAEIIASHGIINVDFADVRTIMRDAGPALVGVGTGFGQERMTNAVTQAVNSPLLEVAIDGAKGVLFTVAGGRDMRMAEINEAAKIIAGSIDPAARVIFGAYHDKRLKQGQVKVTVIATGFNGHFVKSMEAMTSTLFSASARPEKEAPSPSQHSLLEKKEREKGERDVEEKKPRVQEKRKEEDVWDIPAFLRRGKKE